MRQLRFAMCISCIAALLMVHGGIVAHSQRAVVSEDQKSSEPLTETWDGEPIVQPGAGLNPPTATHSVKPKFSEEARKGKYTGTVRVEIVVDKAGNPQRPRVVKSAGHGLDENAVAAVMQYRFKPATKDGVPVPVVMLVEIEFRL